MSPVLVVSVFGRGNSLAALLTEKDIPVTLIDITSDMGTSSPEDDESPFGFFQNNISAVTFERLQYDEPPQSVEAGLHVVLSSGPVEFRSPLTKNRFNKLGMSDEKLAELIDQQSFQNGIRSLKNSNFEWLQRISSEVATNTSDYFPVSNSQAKGIALFDHFWIRQASRGGVHKSHEWLRKKNVNVISDIHILDVVNIDNKKIRGFLVKKRNSETSEIINFEQMIWCLTSEESNFINSNILKKLFLQKQIESRWSWVKLRYRMSETNLVEALPLHSLWIKDLKLPWTHDNLFILQKCPSPGLFDVWLRIPSIQRMQKQSILQLSESIREYLVGRLPKVKIAEAESLALDDKSYQEIGPVRFPIFDLTELKYFNKKIKSGVKYNWHQHSPEVWASNGWNAMAEYEVKLLEIFSIWWKQREELRIKNEQKAIEQRKNSKNRYGNLSND